MWLQNSFLLLQHFSVFDMQIRQFLLDINQHSQRLINGRSFYGFWHFIINSPIKEVYAECLAEFQQKYVSEHLEEVGYIKITWLISFKERLVKAWVDWSTHFGNTAISHVEEIHALLKSYLKRSTLDLFEAWKVIQLALLNQLSGLKSNQAKQQLWISLELSEALYGIVQDWISYEALRKMKEQQKLLMRSRLVNGLSQARFQPIDGPPTESQARFWLILAHPWVSPKLTDPAQQPAYAY